MQTQPAAFDTPVGGVGKSDFHDSGVSWGAIFAGAAAAAALSLILLILGFGLGLSVIAPWSYSAAAIGVSTIAWLAFMQLAASGVGGYMAGRLRIKWASVHTDEVFFRDTAHGLLAWAIASLFTATLVAGTARALLGGAVDLGAGAASVVGAAGAAAASASSAGGPGQASNPVDYFSDTLLRADQGTADANGREARMEVTRILATDLPNGKLPQDDRDYLAKLVAKRSGLSQTDAEARVDDVYTRTGKAIGDAEAAAKDTAEKARKAAARSALWMFVALLLGAFIASLAATFGGRLRDADHLHIRN